MARGSARAACAPAVGVQSVRNARPFAWFSLNVFSLPMYWNILQSLHLNFGYCSVMILSWEIQRRRMQAMCGMNLWQMLCKYFGIYC